MLLAPPYKAPKLELPRDARVAVLARTALASAIRQLRRNGRGARIGKDADYAHQLRIGVRRLRVCLRLFDALLPRDLGSIEDDLRWIFQRLGAMREHDVLLRDVVEPMRAATPHDEALAQLARTLGEERSSAARRARRALSSRRYVRLLRTLRLLVATLEPGDSGRARARKWARRRLDKRLGKALALRRAAFGADEVARHELRKELKKLRYTAELMRGLWKPARVKRYLDPLSDLQDVLGALNDIAVQRSMLSPSSELVSSVPREALVACSEVLAAKLAEAGRQLEPAFESFESATPFWRKRSSR